MLAAAAELSRGGLLQSIPSYSDRLGGLGTITYGEWCYTVGAFQSIIYLHLPQQQPLNILDIGCGSGRLYLSVTHQQEPKMPKGGSKLSDKHLETIRKWIEGGLAGNDPDAEGDRQAPEGFYQVRASQMNPNSSTETAAPRNGPKKRPAPPTMTISSRLNDRLRAKALGSMNCTSGA